MDLEEEQERRKTRSYIPNWFSVEIKTGVSASPLIVGSFHVFFSYPTHACVTLVCDLSWFTRIQFFLHTLCVYTIIF